MTPKKDAYMRGYSDGYEDAVAGIEQVASEKLATKNASSTEPVAYRVLAEPDLPVHFARTKADAEHLAHNLLTYRRGCTSARVEPLYSQPAALHPTQQPPHAGDGQ
jgi:hypothetical protein